MGMRRTASKLRKAAKQLLLSASRSLSLLHSPSSPVTKEENYSLPHHHHKSDSTPPVSTILCAICLEPLTNSGEAIFTGDCSHSFHLSCIAANLRHGSLTCPVCRSYWTHLPCSEPFYPILYDSIRYNDDDPIHSITYPPLHFSLIPLTVSPSLLSYPCTSLHLRQAAFSPLQICTRRNHLTSFLSPSMLLPQQQDCHHCLCKRNAYLSVKLTNLQPIDLVLVVSPSQPHLQLLKQAMVLVTFFLRPVDRLAIVTYSSRVFALRRMTSCGKREALRVIESLFYTGQSTEPSRGILEGIKVVKDRAYKNPRCSILHISSSLIRSYNYEPNSVMQMGVMVHRFDVGFGMQKLEEVVEKEVLGGVARDIQLRIGMGIVKIGELRGGEERQVLLDLGVYDSIRLCYSYVEGDTTDECIRRRGETTLSLIGMKISTQLV